MVKRIGDKSIFIFTGLEKAMAKYKPYDYSQRVMIPVSLEDQLVPGEEGEEEKFISSPGGSAEEFIEGDGEEGRYGEGSGDISSADWDCGAGVCEYSGGEEVGSIYVAGEDQGEHPVDVVLYGSQYWEDYELWVCLEGMKEEKYIKFGQNICWNRD